MGRGLPISKRPYYNAIVFHLSINVTLCPKSFLFLFLDGEGNRKVDLEVVKADDDHIKYMCNKDLKTRKHKVRLGY